MGANFCAHTQMPFMHVRPVGHEMQRAPCVPHCWLVGTATHVFATVQQPEQVVAHDVLTHNPAWHTSPARQPRQRPPAAPHAVSSVPLRQRPSGSMQPTHGVVTHAPLSQRPPVQATQNFFAVPHASLRFPGAQLPSGRQHPLEQLHVTPASAAPASGTSAFTHAPSLHANPNAHCSHESPPLPQLARAVPARHSPDGSQQPEHDRLSHTAHAARPRATTAMIQRIWARL